MADEVSLPPEKTTDELEARHEQELEELQAKGKQHVAEAVEKAGKGKKKKQAEEAAEREVEQWLYELSERQKEELELLQEHLEGGASAPASASASKPTDEEKQESGAKPDAAEDEAERARKKKEKALKKRQGKAEKEAEKEREKELEKQMAGPSAREQELMALQMRLAALKPPMRIHEIVADGHCIYRSVGDQLRRFRPDAYSFKLPVAQVHDEIRSLCASALRSSSNSYSPFAELKDDEDFEGYCKRVESSADWGGELELRALADHLKLRIEVFRAEAGEPLVLGDGDHGEPLRVAFHRHYYALGEHYNSVIPMAATGGYTS